MNTQPKTLPFVRSLYGVKVPGEAFVFNSIKTIADILVGQSDHREYIDDARKRCAGLALMAWQMTEARMGADAALSFLAQMGAKNSKVALAADVAQACYGTGQATADDGDDPSLEFYANLPEGVTLTVVDGKSDRLASGRSLKSFLTSGTSIAWGIAIGAAGWIVFLLMRF